MPHFPLCSSAPLAHQKLQTETLLHILLQIQTICCHETPLLTHHEYTARTDTPKKKNTSEAAILQTLSPGQTYCVKPPLAPARNGTRCVDQVWIQES